MHKNLFRSWICNLLPLSLSNYDEDKRGAATKLSKAKQSIIMLKFCWILSWVLWAIFWNFRTNELWSNKIPMNLWCIANWNNSGSSWTRKLEQFSSPLPQSRFFCWSKDGKITKITSSFAFAEHICMIAITKAKCMLDDTNVNATHLQWMRFVSILYDFLLPLFALYLFSFRY